MKDRMKRKMYSRGTIPKPTRVTYGQGGYASIKDMEKQCMTKTDYNESLKSKDYFRDPDYKYLIEENRKLEEERNELLMDNKKLAAQVADKVNQLRKSGM